ncbi:MAG TPA: fibrillarin-like rRNA/tRNA 2'-O-methyltransferase [Thermoplasmata archaeon]|nr:fibrillarin-like rRNA/tRNA 2'-O-methyltransferase [Thermoplasmata archaeon]
MEPTAWPGVFRHGRDLFTASAAPGRRVYGEELRREGGVEYRRWDPFRSKLAALLLRAPRTLDLSAVRRVLYLGGAHGTTVGHFAELLPAGSVFVVEKSPIAFPTLLEVVRPRANLYPILADAQLPERYAADVGSVDFVYQDVAQRQQARIFVENCSALLATPGAGVLMLKVRSVTQTKPPRRIVAEARAELEAAGLRVTETVDLGPFARDHHALLVRAESGTFHRS